MNRQLKYLLLANIAILSFIVYSCFDLICLAVDNASNDIFTNNDLDFPLNYNITDNRIPKIIHQTYKTEDIPKHWIAGQQRCINLHPDYKYILWTDEMALSFIKEEYPWFLSTFKSYKYPIERADAIRYFVLYHYGGIYIDLDDGCNRRLDPLLSSSAFVRRTSPSGISNDVMGSIPKHPFFLKLMHSLKKYDKNWFVPYLTIMCSTGPMFVSMVWIVFKRWGVDPNFKIKVLQPFDYKGHENSFFEISKGSSWHLDDAAFIKSLAFHILSCVVFGFVFVYMILYFEYVVYCWLSSNDTTTNTTNNSNDINNSIAMQRRVSVSDVVDEAETWFIKFIINPLKKSLRSTSNSKSTDLFKNYKGFQNSDKSDQNDSLLQNDLEIQQQDNNNNEF